jgi:hypothetical protein
VGAEAGKWRRGGARRFGIKNEDGYSVCPENFFQ